MAGGVTLQVRQIASYPALESAGPGDLILTQPGGLGNPYATIDAATLVATALSGNQIPLGVSQTPPADTAGGVFADQLVLPLGDTLFWNAYVSSAGSYAAWRPGISGALTFNYNYGFNFSVGTATSPVTFTDLCQLLVSGDMVLDRGTLTVARDPGSALEVATMGWVGNNTVASFNGRKGVVQLTSGDIYGALCLDSAIATQNWVMGQIQASLQQLLATHPFVFGWNGRTGNVYLTLADITCVFFQPGQQPVTQTPPLTSNDYSIPNTQWVVEYIANEFAGGGSTLATQAWVLANTVNSFNGRQGPVTLTSADVYDVGAAPLNSPAFSGIPTAPTAAVGQATGQIATTAFVQQAITNNTAGVSTFNTRSGDVVLEAADITTAGGLTNPSANLTGAPTCATAAPGTSTPQIANTQFVMAAIAAGTVQSFNTRTGAVVLTLADVTGVGGAPLVSPAFSSVPTAPTAAPGTNTVQLATTAFVTAAVTAAGGVSSFNSRTGAVTLAANDISAAGGLVNPSVGLTGSPTATTATAGDNSTRIATTAFVQTALSSGAVSSFNTRTGAVTLQGADITAAGGALLASPAFTGAPTAPTATAGTNNTQIATTAYVTAAILADTTGVTSFNTRTGAVSLLLADITGAGGAPIASPSFTGVPLGPTATAGTSTTQLATTAFVQAAIASSGVSSFNSRTGAVTLIANDISAAGGALLAGPTFTGVPAAPTAAPGTNTTQLATTAFVTAALGSYVPLAGGSMTGILRITPANAVPTTNPPTNPGLWAQQAVLSGNGPTIGWNCYQGAGTATFYAINAGAAAAQFAQVGPAFGTAGYVWSIGSNFTAGQAISAWSGQMSMNASNGGLLALGNGNTTGAVEAGFGSFGNQSAYNLAAAALLAQSATQHTAIFGCYVPAGGFTAGLFRVDQTTNTLQFFAYQTAQVGSITTNGTTIAVNGTSDGRLKTNIVPLADSGALIDRLAPVSFNWIDHPEVGSECGFVAQDVESIFPQAVTAGSGEPGDEDFRPYGMDNSKLVPVMVAELQALRARVAALEAKAA